MTDKTTEFKQMEMLVEAVTTLTNNQFELLATIRTCGERINILVERVDIHLHLIDDLKARIDVLEQQADKIEAIQTYSDDDRASDRMLGRVSSMLRHKHNDS
jgi:late competence protein required for DNA uptake (superfamily II DNA/RNA helicase)